MRAGGARRASMDDELRSMAVGSARQDLTTATDICRYLLIFADICRDLQRFADICRLLSIFVDIC